MEGNPIPQDWLDAIQEFIGSQASPNLVVSIVNPTTLRVAAGADNAQVSCAINGKWRWISANADAAAPGGLTVGDNPVFIAASDNSFASNPTPPPREIDSTDYSFRLIVKPVGSTPSGTGAEALYRQIGTATWDGVKFTDVRQTVGGGSLPKHAPTHNPGGSDALNWSSIALTINGYGTLAARPAAITTNAGFIYYATDTTTLYRSNGTSWDSMTAAPPSNTSIAGAILTYGTLAGRPVASGSNTNFYYWTTDTGILYQNQANVWVPIAGSGTGRYSTTIGDGASTSYLVTHSLGTTDVLVQVKETGGLQSYVLAEIETVDANSVRVIFDSAPAVSAYRVVVIGGGTQTSTVGGVGAYVASLGDGVHTQYAITHGLNTRDANVTVRQTVAPFAEVYPDVEYTDANTVTLTFAAVVTANAYSVFVNTSTSRIGAASQHAPQHIAGGSDAISSLLSAKPVLETGIAGQIRAGRVLGLTDFTTLLGLAAPQGLWNLGDLTDVSGNGRNLTNKGAVTFGSGVTGAVTEAAIFTGSVGQVLYASDAGAGDPFRVPYGSFGFWFRTAKTGLLQTIMAKVNLGATDRGFQFTVDANNCLHMLLATAAGAWAVDVPGISNVADNRWHFGVVTYDGMYALLYVDGVAEAQSTSASGPLNGSAGPFNIGGDRADGGNNSVNPFYGRIDEAFVTQDILSPDQVRALYAAKTAHGLVNFAPIDVTLAVRRRRKGGALAVGDFPATPLHLYNFTGGSLADAGTLGNPLTNNNAAVVSPGADGTQGNAFNFVTAASQYLSATDAGLPAGTTARTMGCWFKSTTAGSTLISYGSAGAFFELYITGGGVFAVHDGVTATGSASVIDGQWHFGVVVADNAAADGLKVKLYADGKLVATSTTLNGTTLGGAARLTIGREAVATSYMNGQLDALFVTDYAMTSDQIAKLYAVGSQQMLASPKNAGDHVEGFDATNLYLICDTLESQHLVDIVASAA